MDATSVKALFRRGQARLNLGELDGTKAGPLIVAGGCTDSSNMKPGEGGEELSDVWVLDTRIESADLTWSCVSSCAPWATRVRRPRLRLQRAASVDTHGRRPRRLWILWLLRRLRGGRVLRVAVSPR